MRKKSRVQGIKTHRSHVSGKMRTKPFGRFCKHIRNAEIKEWEERFSKFGEKDESIFSKEIETRE